jgi:thymidine kinase
MGCIEVIAGSMFSGKTEELIRRLRRARIAKQKVQLFKPTVDDRYSEEDVVSHNGTDFPGIPIDDANLIHRLLDPDTTVVAIDEGQFFNGQLISVATKLANQGIRVIVAGLAADSDMKPFGPIPELMAVADEVVKLTAICVVCGEDAAHSFHKGSKDEQVEVGADQYEARCRRCYVEGMKDTTTVSAD